MADLFANSGTAVKIPSESSWLAELESTGEFDSFFGNAFQPVSTQTEMDIFIPSNSTIANKEIATNQKNESLENRLNSIREDYLDKHVTEELVSLFKEENFEFGYISKSEVLISKQLSINISATKNWLNKIFVENFDKAFIVIGILRILGRFEERLIFPQGLTMALSATVHKEPEVQELGIRAFENWGTEKSLKVLCSINIATPWIKNYIDQVIADLQQVHATTN